MSRPPVEVRRACVDDLDDLLLIWAESREELSRSIRQLGALPVDQMRARLHDVLAAGEPTILIARFEGAPAGYAVLRLAPVLAVDGDSLHIDQIYVLRGLRRHGAGRGLLVAATQIAERNGADQMLAGAPPGARDSHRFLARLGFSPLAVRRVVATAVLRRRLAGEGQRRGLEDLLSRRRSLRARAARAGWPGGWSSGGRSVDGDADAAAAEATASDVRGSDVRGSDVRASDVRAADVLASDAAAADVPNPCGAPGDSSLTEDLTHVDLARFDAEASHGTGCSSSRGAPSAAMPADGDEVVEPRPRAVPEPVPGPGRRRRG